MGNSQLGQISKFKVICKPLIKIKIFLVAATINSENFQLVRFLSDLDEIWYGGYNGPVTT